MTSNTPLKLISMSEINAEEVQWLWYPYIPLGKLTILQGDPGEGKTSFILAVIAALTRGEPLPECERAAEPMNVIYRGLGSIDFRASARSVLIVGRLKSGDTLRIVAQDKNSLAPEGAAIAFELHPEHGFQWKGFCDATVDNILNGTGQVQTKTMQMEDELRRFLTQPRPAEEVLALAKQLGISERTLKIAKRNLGILSERRADQWLWRLPEQEGKRVTP